MKDSFVQYENLSFRILGGKSLSLVNEGVSDIREIIGLQEQVDLEELNLESNLIEEIKGLENLKSLRTLKLSFNRLYEIKGLESLINLEELFLIGNQITEIKGLENLTNLRVLSLSSNQLSQIKGLNHLTNLEELYLIGNQITELEGLENLTNLRVLGLSSNQITKIKGLNNLVNLKELFLIENKIEEIEGLDNLISLELVDLSFNEITTPNDLEQLPNLKSLVLRGNPLVLPSEPIQSVQSQYGGIQKAYVQSQSRHKPTEPAYRRSRSSSETDKVVIALVVTGLIGGLLLIVGIVSIVNSFNWSYDPYYGTYQQGSPAAGITLLVIGIILLSIATKGRCLYIFACLAFCSECD
ncbi:MAG: leucine-rich repeat domain-containing protein [Candidatus Hodarchaeota archaeon]